MLSHPIKCPTTQQSVLHQVGNHSSTEPKHQLLLHPNPQNPNSHPSHHRVLPDLQRKIPVFPHTSTNTSQQSSSTRELQLHTKGVWHQRKVVQPLPSAFFCSSKSRSSADKTATKSCPIPSVCFQNTRTNTAAAEELAEADWHCHCSVTHTLPWFTSVTHTHYSDLSQTCMEHLSPPQPCQAHELCSKQEPNCSVRNQ